MTSLPTESCVASDFLQIISCCLKAGLLAGLVFVDPGAKINGSCYRYRDELLLKRLLPVIHSIFLFQQDRAPAHRARNTLAFLDHGTPHFIGSTELWPQTVQV